MNSSSCTFIASRVSKSITRYYTKKDLAFYTTPIQNEFFSYINYKKWWVQPGLAISYGWGSKTEFEQREVEVFLRRLHASKRQVIYIRNNESVKDFSTMISARHHFEWYKIFGKKDMLSLTPVLLLSGGTLNYGFNTSFSSNSKFITNNFLPSNQNISDVSGFDLQSAIFVLQLDYSIGKLYIQPQVLVDYYLHTSDKRLNNVFSVTAGYSIW